MPEPKGPGRNSATSATISSNTEGCSFLIRSFMPRDSSWNTAVVSARFKRSKEGLSSNGIASILIGSLPCFSNVGLMVFNAQSTMVKVLRPTFRVIPSSFNAMVNSSRVSSSLSYNCCSWGSSSSALVSVIPTSKGISFAIRSTKPYPLPYTRPTSRTTAFAAIEP